MKWLLYNLNFMVVEQFVASNKECYVHENLLEFNISGILQLDRELYIINQLPFLPASSILHGGKK